MFTINFKGKQNPKDKNLVKIEMVFFKTGYARVSKVISITGPYKEWDQSQQGFKGKSSDISRKNKELVDLKTKYLKVAEDWEYEGCSWVPVEWSHFFDKKPEEKKEVKILPIDKCIDIIVEDLKNRKRFKNGIVLSSVNNARQYKSLQYALREFTHEVYNKSFSTYYFKDIDETFLKNFVLFLQERGTKRGNMGAVTTRVRKFFGVFYYASKMDMPDTERTVFNCVKLQMKAKDVKPQSISYEYIKKMEQLDRSKFTEREQLHIDIFLFSFYAGGMANIDVCYLNWDCIENDIICYERIKFPKKATVPFNDKAKAIVEKYRHKCYGNFVLPIFTHKHKTEIQKRNKVDLFREAVNKTLKRVSREIGCDKEFTGYAARGTFITKMIDEGFHPLAVASMAGNHPKTIYKHYWEQTEPGSVLKTMNRIL